MQSYLVGGIPTPPTPMKVSWDYEIPNRWKNNSHVPVTTNQIYVAFTIENPYNSHEYPYRSL